MDTGFSQQFIPGPEFPSPAESNAHIPSDYAGLAIPLDPTSFFHIVPTVSNGQFIGISQSPNASTNANLAHDAGLSTHSYDDSFTSHGTHPNLNDRSSDQVYSTFPPMDSSNFANMSTNTNTTLERVPTMPINSGAFEDFARQWPNFTQAPTSLATTVDSAPRYSYNPNTATHSSPPIQPPMSAPPVRYPEDSEEIQHHSPQHPFLHGQVMMNAGAHSVNPEAVPRQARNLQSFSHSGAPAVNHHQRRHHRTNPLGPAPSAISSHHRARSNTHSSRARQRPTTTSSPANYSQVSSAQSSVIHNQRNHTSNNAAHHSPSTTIPAGRPSTQHHEVSAQVSEGDQVQDWVQNMRPGELRAIYEATLARSRRAESAYFISAVSKKILDSPRECRPEPKETEELTVNMECKVCMTQLVDTVLLPCGHAILCQWCADKLIPSSNGYPKGKTACPMCRDPIKQKVRIFTG
ncbi:hypothetical protein ASPVEDRAFT_28807 [Aspergillus versicolor CBS 583.65]|uniref:RING-type domain-containing protein n=1 Tax=Aspergillus versicolor CBS 583.65 TaxID=1036611 RepID=A0A1L9PL55_ASPVE|nr:uncharacterized protein ASPVEDRAFT_28807 [Aspergillus versicolor CBS 583.65]OJJ02202.1 hypothetical protein ASPVEDRAFT_28807 [Aspergillus versicolor CBS 583.65]